MSSVRENGLRRWKGASGSNSKPPSGWVQMLRGPRPPSDRWPRVASCVQQFQRKAGNLPRTQRPSSPPNSVGRDFRGPRKALEEVQASAEASVIRPERALAVLDESDVVAGEALEMSLTRAGAQAASAPPEDRLKSCEEFVRRAQKRLSQAELDVQTAVKNRDQMQAEFEEGQ